MNNARLGTGAAIAIAAALMTAACSSPGHPTAGPATTHGTAPATLGASATPATTAPTVPSPSPTPSPTGATGTPPATSSPSPSPSTCAQMAANTFIHITAVTNGPDGSLSLTGNPATLVCGGFDDLHYNVATTTESAHVDPGATITVWPVTVRNPPVSIGPYKLASYLATDTGTRIFLVTGPLGRITGLAEQFHP
jgi:hypothetical protein